MEQRAEPDFAETAPAIQIPELNYGARRWRSIFAGVMALFTILVWAAFVEQATHEHRQALDTVSQRDANLATAVDHYAVRVFRNARAVHHLVGNVYREDEDEAQLLHLLRDRLLANDAFVELAACMNDGRVLSSLAAGTLLDAAHCTRLAAATRPSTEVTVGAPIAFGGGLYVPLTLPLPGADGAPAGVAVALAPVTTMMGIMASASLHDRTTVVLAGDDGVVRAAWRSDGGAVTDPAQARALAGLGRGAQAADPMIDGRPQLVSTRRLPTWDLRVVVATDRQDALAAFYRRRLLYLALCAAITLGIVAVYVVLSRIHGESVRRAKSLSRARGQLQALNLRLDAQVQERTAQLEQAYRDLESFSYTIAHDVRAPLAAIGTFAEELVAVVAAGGSEKHQRYLRRIQANAAQMNQLTQQLLELGQLTRAPLRLAPVDLGALAQEVLARLQDCDGGRSVDVVVQPGLVALADAALARQVLENLLGNAWKFTGGRAQPRIVFGRDPAAAADGWQTFFVSDNGAGFDSEAADGLFQPFRRMHTASEFPGTGVGLATVQRIVALHGGRVWCQSRPQAGATFYFTLRAVPSQPAPYL